MKPLLIIKVDAIISPEIQAERMKIIKSGIEQGALVLGGECEIIAFDSEGRLSYPIQKEASK